MSHFGVIRCFDLLLGTHQLMATSPLLSFFESNPKQIGNLFAPFKVAKGLVVTGPRLNLEGAHQQTYIEQMTYRLSTYVASGS